MVTLKEIQVKSILSRSNLPVADYAANPYVGCEHACKYCYANFMKRFTNHLEPWGDFVDVKHWPTIKHPEKFAGKDIFVGSVTDPYQPAEIKYGKTRTLLEQLQGSGCHLYISTKSDLILRDIDLIKTFPNARVSLSINTLDETFRKQIDKGASIERRIDAMAAFHEAGIHSTCFISPIFPKITNPQEIILRTRNYCDLVWLENLNLRGNYKMEILNFIKKYYSKLSNLYGDIYVKGKKNFWHQLDNEIRDFATEMNFTYLNHNEPQINENKNSPLIINYFFHEEVIGRK